MSRVERPNAFCTPAAVDNWPAAVPVSARERDVGETYRGALHAAVGSRSASVVERGLSDRVKGQPRVRRPARSPAHPQHHLDLCQVVDDLPRPVPISRVELEVLETYLGAQIDALLRAIR